MHQDTRHGQPANSDLDAPWALPVPPVLPAVPRRGAADVAPPPDPPPLPERTFWTDTLKGLEDWDWFSWRYVWHVMDQNGDFVDCNEMQIWQNNIPASI